MEKYGVINTTFMAGTDNRAFLRDCVFLNADGITSATLQNGNIVEVTAKRYRGTAIPSFAYVANAPTASTPIERLGIVANPIENSNCIYNVEEYKIDAFKIFRVYLLSGRDIFDATSESFTIANPSTLTEGSFCEVVNGQVKLQLTATRTAGNTLVGIVSDIRKRLSRNVTGFEITSQYIKGV